MKVLFVHDFYKQSGGEDQAVYQEMNLLKSNGVDVVHYFVDNQDINSSGFKNKIKVGRNTVWSKEQYHEIIKIILKENPNIVHFHNTFPMLSPSVYYACKKLNVPVIQTLHNYRLACPNAFLLRDNQICEKCINGSLLNSIRYGCYHRSRLQTTPLTVMLYFHRMIGTWTRKVDQYIALTNFAKSKFIEIGLESNKISVKPNFIIKRKADDIKKGKKIVFVGRLSEEKGLNLLMKAWENVHGDNIRLEIIGDGPQRNAVESKYSYLKNIKFFGKLERNEVLEKVSEAKYLIVPSIWYEGFPMTIIEAFSVNTPVIASNIGSLKEIVQDNYSGFLFKKGDSYDLEKVIVKAINYPNYNNLCLNVKKQFEENYTPVVNFRIIMGIYNKVIRRARNGK